MSLLGFIGAGVLSLALATLIVSYMRRSRVNKAQISSLRFLPPLSHTTKSRTQWHIAKPLQSPLFWLRLLLLCLLLGVFFVDGVTFKAPTETSLGVLIAVDHSPSMKLGTPSRLEQAKNVANKLEDHVRSLDGCVDTVALSAGEAIDALYSSPSKNGMGPSQLRALVANRVNQSPVCVLTHVAIISDLPKPASLSFGDFAGLSQAPLWFQIGKPQANTAISHVDYRVPSPPDQKASLSVSLVEYGDRQGDIALEVVGPDGVHLAPKKAVDLAVRGNKDVIYELTGAGRYEIGLTEPGGLASDNKMVIDVPSVEALVAVLSPDLRGTQIGALMERLGPVATEATLSSDIQLARLTNQELLKDSGIFFVEGENTQPTPLGYFDRSSPLLQLVDLDLFEAMAPRGLAALPQGFQTIMSGGVDGDRIWLAVREGAKPAVLMPDPPGGLSANIFREDMRTWLVTFLNAYALISSSHNGGIETNYVDDQGNVLGQIAFESDTAQPNLGSARIKDIQPVGRVMHQKIEIWPWLLAVALLVLALERFLEYPVRRAS